MYQNGHFFQGLPDQSECFIQAKITCIGHKFQRRRWKFWLETKAAQQKNREELWEFFQKQFLF